MYRAVNLDLIRVLTVGNTLKGTFFSEGFNPITLRTAKALWSFGFSVCNRVNTDIGRLTSSQVDSEVK